MNPYAGGDTVFNSTPFTQYYLQKLQQKQAKTDALDQYYSNLTKSINTAGVRHTDIQEGLSKKISDWRNYAMQNRDKLLDPRKDHYQTLNEFQSRYQDILNDTEQSKSAAANEMEAGKRYYEMQKEGIATDEDMKTIIPAHQASIYNAKHYKQDGVTPYTVNDLSFLAKEMSPEAFSQFEKSAIGNLKPGTQTILGNILKDKGNPYAGTQNYTERTGYDTPALRQIGDAAKGLLTTPDTQQTFEKMVHDPKKVEAYTPAYQAVYGADKKIETKEDMAAAYLIAKNSAYSDVQKTKEWKNTFGEQSALNSQRFAHAEAMEIEKAKAKQGDAAADANSVDILINKMKQSAKVYNFTNPDGTTYQGKLLPTTDNVLKPLMTASGKPNAAILVKDKDGNEYVQSVYFKEKYKEVKTPTGTKQQFVGYDFNPKTGTYNLDPALTGAKVPLDVYKADYGKGLLGEKINYGEMTGRTKGRANDHENNSDSETIDLGNNN
jgi:hypothetical protein